MAYPTIVRNSTGGGASGTTFAGPAPPSCTDINDGILVAIVSTRVAGDITCIANNSGWFKMGEIQRTSGAIGTTAVFGKWVLNNTTPPTPTWGSNNITATLWWVTYIVFNNVQTTSGTGSGFSLGTAASSAAQTTNALTPTNADSLVFGVFADSRTTTLSGTPTAPATEYIDTFNATYDIWHWVGYKQVASPASTSVTVTPSASASLREAVFTIEGYPTNTAPTFSIQPTITISGTYSVGSATALTRLGLSNSGTISFRATDAEQTGANALTYEIRTSATVGGGSLVGSGTCTSGTTKTHVVDSNDTGLTTNGNKTLYVQVSDGTTTTVSNVVNVAVDRTAPTAATSISTDPATVNDYERYRVTLTPNDATSLLTNDLHWEIRTATGGGGTLLASGLGTNATAVTSAFFNDTALVNGSNTRYIRVQDAGGNITQTTFTVTRAQTHAWDQITTLATGTDDGYWTPGSTTFTATNTLLVVGWAAASITYNTYLRFQLLAEPGYTIDYATIRMAIQGVFAGAITLRIRGVLELNPAAPTTVAGANALPLTTASATLSTSSMDVDGEPVELPDLSAILTEIKAQPGWTAGNYVMFVIDTTTAYVNTTYQVRWDSYENSDTTPRFYVEWTEQQTYDEVTSTASTMHSFEGSSVEALVMDQLDTVSLLYSFEGGEDGMVFNETDGLALIYVATGGVNTGTQDDLATEANVVYVSTTSSVLALNMLVQGQEGVFPAFTGGSDAATFNEFEDSVEAILEASSTLEDHDMYILGDVVEVQAYTSGFDQVEGELDESNPVIIYVETMGTDEFELGPQVYDEETIDVTVAIFPQLSGEDTSTMHDLQDVDVYHAYTNFGIEFFQGRFEEFNDPIVIGVVESGTDTMNMNASLDTVMEIGVVSTGTDAQQHVDLGGETIIESVEQSSLETLIYGEYDTPVLIGVTTSGTSTSTLVETTGNVMVGIEVLGDLALFMSELVGETIIDTITAGYEGNLIEEIGGFVEIPVYTDGEDLRILRKVSTYTRSVLVSVQPYVESTLEVLSPYYRSTLVSIQPHREGILAAAG